MRRLMAFLPFYLFTLLPLSASAQNEASDSIVQAIDSMYNAMTVDTVAISDSIENIKSVVVVETPKALKAERDYDEVIFTSPDGERFDQHMANELSLKGNLIILAGHYKGIDQRIREHLITKEISIGDFVLTGGELVAAMIADAIVRVVPGVIGDEQSALSDCFQDDILAAPIYTRPAEYKGWKVPEILLSGNEAKIREWEFEQAMERTRRLRPDLLK